MVLNQGEFRRDAFVDSEPLSLVTHNLLPPLSARYMARYTAKAKVSVY